MANKNNNNKKAFIQVKTKNDTKEVIVTKSPAKTKTGIVFVWLICACTLLVPLAGLVYLLISLFK